MLRYWKSRFATVVIVALCATSFAPFATAQEQDEPLETLKVDVNVVNLYFNVKDKRGGLIPGLARDEFQVFEDGQPQQVKYFTAETELPLTMGLLVDTSGSMREVLPIEREVAGQFLRDVMRSKDLAFLISFDVNVELLEDLTASDSELREGLNRTRVNVGGGGSLPGLGGGPIPTSNPRGTLLYDAIFLAADEKLRQEAGRKAMIVLTDGMDQGSQMTLQQAAAAAHKADAIVYVLLLDGLAYGTDEGKMKRIAEETGGRVINVDAHNEKKMRAAFEQIAKELRSQYSIGYTPTNNRRDGTFRKVEIKPKTKDLRVQTRKGYYAPKG